MGIKIGNEGRMSLPYLIAAVILTVQGFSGIVELMFSNESGGWLSFKTSDSHDTRGLLVGSWYGVLAFVGFPRSLNGRTFLESGDFAVT
jgi:hypothetical protein